MIGRPGLGSTVRRLPLPAWQVLGADLLSAVGTGLTLPFLLVYLHAVRGFGLPLAGSVVASVAVVSMVGNPVGGWLADRCGPRAAVLFGLSLASAGAAGWVIVDTPAEAFGAAAVSGLGVSISWPAHGALLARLAAPQLRSSMFAIGNATSNAGMAVGGVLAALIVGAARPDTFVALYLLDAASFAVAFAIVWRVREPAAVEEVEPGSGRPATPTGGGRRAGYRAVARDRVMVGVWLLAALLATAGYGQVHSALPVLAMEFGLATGDLGLLLAANTVAVVVLQLVVLRAMAGRRRTRATALLALAWAVSWALMLAAGLVESPAAVLGILVASTVVFAFGETLLWPSLPAIVNDVAPDALRGRYNGAFTHALTTGMVAGPLLSGFALDHGLAAWLLILLVLACTGCAALALALERVVPAAANLVPVPRVPAAARD